MATLLQTGPQYGVPYVLTGPDGERAVFNDSTDPDYVGALEDITGFDSPEVRESADNLVNADGGIHGSFYYGRRPVTLSGKVFNVASAAERNTKLTKIQRASNAMRADATLTWTPAGGEAQQIKVRRQQPLRISGGWAKDFQIALVAADPRIYSAQLYTNSVVASGAVTPSGRTYPLTYPYSYGAYSAASLGNLAITNSGDAPTPPILVLTGPGTNPTIVNTATGERIAFFVTLSATDSLTVDMLNRTVTLNNTSAYALVDFTNSQWWSLVPGSNTLSMYWTSFTNGASLAVQWRNAWL